jgi:tellurite resistance protein
MRHYNTDTPQARARLIVAAALADGGLDKAELDALDRQDLVRRLGLSAGEFDGVIHGFYEDMQCAALRDHGGQLTLDRATIDQLLSEVRTPALQIAVLGMMLDVTAADGRLSPGELTLVSQAMTRWGLELHAVSAHSEPVGRASR